MLKYQKVNEVYTTKRQIKNKNGKKMQQIQDLKKTTRQSIASFDREGLSA